MGWKLDDNARSGLHYLALGVVMIGIPAAMLAAFDLWHARAIDDGTLPLGVFHNGYVLFDGDRTSVADTTRGERLAFACGISFGSAAALTALLLLARSRSAWHIGRWVLLVALIWCIISALFFPRISGEVSPGSLVITERPTIAGDITWPFGVRTTRVVWSKRDDLLGISVPVNGITDVFRMSYSCIHDGDTLLFATTAARSDLFGPNALRTPSDDAGSYMYRVLYQR